MERFAVGDIASMTGREDPPAREPDDPARLAWERAFAATEPGEARRWMERAYRLLPGDRLVGLTLGSFRLLCGDAGGAGRVWEPLAAGVPAAAAGLAAARMAMGDREGAAAALAQALAGSVVGPALAELAEQVGPRWCGLGADGRLRYGSVRPDAVWCDGQMRDADDPMDGADSVVVEGFLGSPVPVRRLRAVQGFVAEEGNGLGGWAWCPPDPERQVRLVARGPNGSCTVPMVGAAEGVEDLPPLARPRRFVLNAAACDALGTPVAITDEGGRALLGSPIWRGIGQDLGWETEAAGAPRVDRAPRGTDVVIPVFGAAAEAVACVRAVLATVPAGTTVHVVDDASPEPGLRQQLEELAAQGRVRLHSHRENRGFPAAANTGLRAAAGRDAVLLNSDTVVSPGWLERLRAAVYGGADVGSATPLSDDGSIVSVERRGEAPAALDGLLRNALAGEVAELPVGVGFCLFIRRDCLDQVGPLREDLFAQGYGEESEFCLRARRLGWRHVAALDVFVAHRGGASFGGSFGAARTALRRRNQAILERLYPGYAGLVAGFGRADPLFAARRRIAAAQWAAGRMGSAAVLVSHGEGGGVAELVAARAAAWRRAGVRPIVLIPAEGGCQVQGWAALRFAIPGELPLLAELLREDGVTVLERHHLLGHEATVLALAGLLGVPMETWVHDASLFCPRVALIGAGRRYCGEPEVAGCEACVAALGSNLPEPIGPAALVARSAAELAGSGRVVVPTVDTGRRLRRHFPAAFISVMPWEDDRALPPVERRAAGRRVRVVVVGAIGVEKGFDVLLACAADARARALPIEFVVCGRTEDDERLMAAGPAFVTGRYEPGEAVELIRAQDGQVAFIPSIWPETWCFALSRAWEAGLPAVAFDLGAPAERIRATGRGSVLPLGLPAARVNDALLRLA